MNSIACFVALFLASQVAAPAEQYSTTDGNPVLDANILVKDEANIPAVEAGMLIEMGVREGTLVKKDEILARIDDRKAKAAVKVTRYAEQAAKKASEQDIEKRYAQAAADVAKVEWEQGLESNRLHKGAVVETELRRMKLDFKRATLQIEKAINDQYLAGLDANTKTAEREAAEMELDWRTIRAPFDGDVTKTNIQQSEWVNPGDPILTLTRFDTLYVEAFVRADLYDRSEVFGKPVTVEVTKARGRKTTVEGRIVHADQMLQGRGIYTVRAEVTNERVNGSWLLQPGGVARMTILIDQPSRQPLQSRIESREALDVRR